MSAPVRALTALADVICRAQKNGKRTPMGIAHVIDAAGMLQSPETAAEHEREVREAVAKAIEDRGRAFLPTHPVYPYVGVFAAIALGEEVAPRVAELTVADRASAEYLFCGADLGREVFPYTCYRRIGHDGPCGPELDADTADRYEGPPSAADWQQVADVLGDEATGAAADGGDRS